ncbi:wax ester/triacylglycerol synthase domain-containing protein [Leifsonia sp. LS-T14]|uniref:wax ester/triacylglycerol synthase domain-containing protein n=1 Tax=unclassified Leifsonia TaxID=2663824 RepID=UPI0035A70D00
MDAANLILERGQPNVVTLAGLLAPGGFVDASGFPDIASLRDTLAMRVGRVAALQRVAQRVDGEWTWRTAAPSLTHHVRLVEPDLLAQSARDATGFERTCARVVMKPLDANRPLWEILLVPHAAEDRCGLIFRLHHAVADGLGAEALIASLADSATGGTTATAPARQNVDAVQPTRRPRIRGLGDFAAQTLAVFRRDVHSDVLLGPLGPTRDIAFADVDLSRLHDAARRLGGTINDVFLAAFGQGIRALLIAAGEAPPATLPVSSPVRLERQPGAGNATGVMLIDVPVGSADPPVDLEHSVALVAAATRREKARARSVGTFRWMRTPRAAHLLMRFALHQRAVGAIASEMTGPPRTLHIGGSELIAAWPIALLSGNVRAGVLAVSYAGRLCISVQTDNSHLPPANVLAKAMRAALERMSQ